MLKKFVYLVLLLALVGLVFVFFFLPQQADSDLNPVVDHPPYPVSERAQALHSQLVVGDWHADTMLWSRDIGKENDYGHVDLPRLQQGNVGLQMFTTVTKSPSGLNYEQNSADAWDDITTVAVLGRWPIKTWSSLAERALHQARKLHRFAKKHPEDLMIVRSQAGLEQWQERRKTNPKLVGGLIGTEGSHALDGQLENVQTLYDAGFRMMSLQHFFDNKLGASLHGISQGGLSEFGRQVIQEIRSRNIILDVSHSSEQVVRDVLQMKNGPVVVSHTGFKGHCDTQRNIADELMQGIAEQGGLIAVGFWGDVICGENVNALADSIIYGIELVGAEHLSLGSDFDGTVETIFDTSELAALTHALLERNLSEADVSKIMGGNMLRFLSENLPAQ